MNTIIEKYGINKKHVKHLLDTESGKQEIIEKTKDYEKAVAKNDISMTAYLNPNWYWDRQLSEYYVQCRFDYIHWELNTTGYTEEELNKCFNDCIEEYKIAKEYVPFMSRNHFLIYAILYQRAMNDEVNMLHPSEEVERKCKPLLKQYEQQKAEEEFQQCQQREIDEQNARAAEYIAEIEAEQAKREERRKNPLFREKPIKWIIGSKTITPKAKDQFG